MDGIGNVARALEDIENDKIEDLDYFEATCVRGGCVGGPLVFESFICGAIACTENLRLRQDFDETTNSMRKAKMKERSRIDRVAMRNLRTLTKFPDDDSWRRLTQELHGKAARMDCGSCGAPLRALQRYL